MCYLDEEEENEEGKEEEIEIDENDQHLDIFEDLINDNKNDEKDEDDGEGEDHHMITIDVQSSILVNDLLITSTIQQNNSNNNISLDIFTRKTDQVSIKGNLLKYSK